MLTQSRIRVRLQAVWAFALVVAAPAFAQAQQTGLFPLAPIRRERVPCEAEDPYYAQYRKQYYGYFPTCWRRFPPGWGCPSPEAPNAKEAFKELPRQDPPDDTAGPNPVGRGAGPGMDDDEAPPTRNPANNRPDALPALPRGDRSPFDLDAKPDTPPRGSGPGAGASARPGLAPLGGTIQPPATAALEPREIPGGESAGDSLLGLPEPANPGSNGPAPPAPAVPGAIGGGAGAGASFNPNLPGPVATGPNSTTTDPLDLTGMPAQAPQRRTVIGTFFNNFRTRFQR